ncbi:M23 family metallopeptidase [Oligoflexia bacterium]|nr:M23 family metallopeptidase [Oligoflexia bacterium]
MKLSFSKDFCLWVVPSNDGRVRKIRFTLKRALALFGVVGFVAAMLLYVAGDYTRVQIIRAKTFFTLQRVSAQRDNLTSTNQDLNHKLGNLKEINAKVLDYERNVRQRLDELSSVIDTASSMGLIPPEKRAKKTNRSDDGIGGAEIDCNASGRCNEDSESYVGSLTLALVNPSKIDDLTERVDRYVDLLRYVPLGSPANGHVTSGYGMRRSPFTRRMRHHEGIDFSVPTGSYIYSAADGIVKSVKRNSTYGVVIDIMHNNRVTTRYAHLSKALVKEGDKICRSQTIGLVGSTGRSTGPHLHYEVIVGRKAINPLALIKLARKLDQTL